MSSIAQRRTLALGAALLVGGLVLATHASDDVVVPQRPALAAQAAAPDLTPLTEAVPAIRAPALRAVEAPEPADRRPAVIRVPPAPRSIMAVAAPAVKTLSGEMARIVIPTLLPPAAEATPMGVKLADRSCTADRTRGATGATYFIAGS